ncbi:hypothetical protein HYV88_02380 [Candidatus Woesearchaeota archaeon]|nr:hypothetical protein [Candidatus Woesearchaeota archaeon]
MAKNKADWNTVLVVLVIGVVGILLLGGNGISGAQIYKKLVKETVRCSFSGSNNVENCYSDSEKWSCKGQSFCDVTVSGSYGEKITWKSSCGGYVTTVIDGKDEKVLFVCSVPPTTEIKANSCDGDSVCEAKAFQAKDLAGEGTNYVCVDNKGILFNSPVPCVQEVPTPKCTDSDVTKNIPDGKNYYTLGKTCVGDFCKPDRCIDDKNLMEYYCQTPEESGSITYNCKGGCKNGVCLWLY